MYGYYMARIRKMVICPKCGQRKIIENETGKKKKKKKKKKGVSRCTVLKSDPPALRTGNDKFRISFSHVQRSLSNRKPAERERERKKKKNHSDCIQLGSQLTRCATSSQLRLQKCSVGGTTTDLKYPNTQYNDWGRPSVGHLDNCRDRPERFWGLVVFMEWADRSRSLWRHAFFQPGLTAMAICTFQQSFQFQINSFTLLSCTVPGVHQWGTPESILDKTMISGLASSRDQGSAFDTLRSQVTKSPRTNS